ncbi:MAG: hypothetical protein M1282_11040 [Chloroflexi bacterium]|nr:hypothetical protein [Chloroflexota bacterium]
MKQQKLFALVLGVTDGIFNALTLAAGRVLNASASIEAMFALRIAIASSFSGFFVFFVADYSRQRAGLIQAERHLNLTQYGRLAKGYLGRAVAKDALEAAGVSVIGSFFGALLPLLTTSLMKGPAVLAIVAAILALGVVGMFVGRAVHGTPWLWSMLLMLTGSFLTLLGIYIHIT